MSKPEISKWVHGDELMEKWKVDEYELVRLCNERKLTLYSAHDFKSMEPITNTGFIRHCHGSLRNFFKLHWFSLEDIERIEEEQREQKAKVPIKKLRPNQILREQVRALAEKIWKKNSTMTIEEMIKHEKITEITIKKNGDYYLEKTVRNWIKEACPNRKPGRRPKANKSAK